MMSEEQQQSAQANQKVRPLITPDAFSGETTESWDDWLGHFESVARINGWDESTCLLWLEVRLTGKAHNAWRRLSTETKAQYSTAKAALKKRFEPDSRRELYMAEFQTRTRRQGESWEELADNIRLLADKAFPELEDKAKEQLSLDRYLALLDKPEVALAVRQKHPKTVDEAVSSTLEIESYMLTVSNHKPHPISSVDQGSTHVEATVSTVLAKQDKVMDMLRSLNIRMDKLERVVMSPAEEQLQGRNLKDGNDRFHEGPIICHRCKQEGHYARGCAAYRGVPKKTGN